MKVGIAGFGSIGGAFGRCFERSSEIELAVYDRFISEHSAPERLAALNTCDIVFVAVPTPSRARDGRCDISAVESVVRGVHAPLCIKSTVPPGTTDRLIAETGKRIAFSPEFMGESAAHPWTEIYSAGFAVFGGDPVACANARRAYEVSAPVALRYVETTATLAELSKYMINAFLATKVSFVNQFYDIATQAGLDFDDLRDLFVLDPRIGESHTHVTHERGFGGACLPKDLRALLAWAGCGPETSLLRAVSTYNDALRERADRPALPRDGTLSA